MRLYIGVTDGDWYRFLANRPHLTEANFWRPSGAARFRALKPGEPFFFKTHHPHNQVVGGGVFAAFELLPLSTAWEIFQEANGTTGLAQMRQRISHYRKQPISDIEDPIIGCILLRDVRFFASPMAPPPDFAPNIVQGKTYDLARDPSADYFNRLVARLLNEPDNMAASSGTWHRDGPVLGDPRLVPQRLGQRAFQAVVLNAYRHQCAITGSRLRPTLQAAHIRPVKEGGRHRLDNGILLRSDVHTLFDRGYLSIDPDYRLRVSSRLRKEFDAGDEFYQREGHKIALPENRRDYPDPEVLSWHLREVFIA
jgi:Predicted restriction endonuclease